VAHDSNFIHQLNNAIYVDIVKLFDCLDKIFLLPLYFLVLFNLWLRDAYVATIKLILDRLYDLSPQLNCSSESTLQCENRFIKGMKVVLEMVLLASRLQVLQHTTSRLIICFAIHDRAKSV